MRRVSTPQLYLISPLVAEPEAVASQLDAACAAGSVAAVQLRLAAADDRTLVNRLKDLAPPLQAHGVAVLVSVVGEAPLELDVALVAARGGADGVHVAAGAPLVREMRSRLKGERILGVGGLRSKHDAMTLGEEGVDYLMFGEPRPDGSLPPLEAVIERAAWWAEIFETPCVAFAPSLETLPEVRATGAEFVALGDAVWQHPAGPGQVVRLAAAALAETVRA